MQSVMDMLTISSLLVLRWMPQNHTDNLGQHWIRWWLGAVRQQAMTWANIDLDLSHHMASLGHSDSMLYYGYLK